jgi:hypothetical protein
MQKNEKITTCNVRNEFDERWYGETHLVKCVIMRLKMKVKVSYRSEVEIVRVLGDEWMNLEMERTSVAYTVLRLFILCVYVSEWVRDQWRKERGKMAWYWLFDCPLINFIFFLYKNFFFSMTMKQKRNCLMKKNVCINVYCN